MSLLLLLAGDVETNPGPISGEDCTVVLTKCDSHARSKCHFFSLSDELLTQVDDSVLSKLNFVQFIHVTSNVKSTIMKCGNPVFYLWLWL